MTNNCYQKKRKKSFRKKHVKGTKIFLKKKKTKCGNRNREWYRNLSEEVKEKKRQYGREQCKNPLENKYKNYFSGIQEIKNI